MRNGKVPQDDPSDNTPDGQIPPKPDRATPPPPPPPPDGQIPPKPDRATPPPPPDPFDPASLRLSQDFGDSLGVKKTLATIPVKKPEKTWFVRVHPAEDFATQTAVLELKEEREIYLVDRSLWPELGSRESTFTRRALFTAINRQGVLFLWPVRLPGPDGKIDSWSQSALEAAVSAREGWVRVVANMALGAYDIYQATGDLPEPQWPDAPFLQIWRTAFKDRCIDSRDHPVLRRLRGEC